MHFGILGSGIVGLTTALELQKQFPNAFITILAENFLENTTSHVAAGIFRPGTSFMGPTEEITEQWICDSFYYWDDIKRSEEADIAGVCQLSGYIFSSTANNVRNPLIEKLLPIYRQATNKELKLCGGGWKYGSYFTTCLIEGNNFLPYATKKFLSNGGDKATIITRHVRSFSELDSEYDFLFNCTGMGAKQLCTDRHLIPIRGQVVKVHAPWLKMAFYGDYDTYIIPGIESVTLGGCRQYESSSTQVSQFDTQAILDRCYRMLPSLKHAPIKKELVGLRPHRYRVRVEYECLKNVNANEMNIIHNYGHGGYGVTTAPGTAIHAIKIMQDIFRASGQR